MRAWMFVICSNCQSKVVNTRTVTAPERGPQVPDMTIIKCNTGGSAENPWYSDSYNHRTYSDMEIHSVALLLF